MAFTGIPVPNGISSPTPIGGTPPDQSPATPATPATPNTPAKKASSAFDALFDQAEKSEAEGRDESALSRYPADMRTNIKGLVDYKVPLAPTSMRMPYWQAAMSAAQEYDPTFNASEYQNRQALKKSFESGKHADNITSFNTAIGHLGRMNESGQALHNRKSPLWNTIANTVESGVFGAPELTRYEQDANAVASELTRAFRGTGGAEADVQAWRKAMSMNGSPEQLHANVDEAIQLLKSRIQELQDQYRQGMGKNPPRFLGDNARKLLERMGYNPEEIEGHGPAAGKPPVAAGAPAGAPSPAQGDMIQVQIPGYPPGPIHASQLENFKRQHPNAKVLQ